MPNHTQLKLTTLIAALASAYPMQLLANAGVTQFSVGDVSVQRAATTSPLAGGSRVESGDLITTGNTGRTQLRFTDGGMVSLQPNSQFKITRYADSGNAQQDSFLVDLARGGMRALTGLIGKRNRENYKVTTSTATIGIRGSGFSMAYNPDGTLAVTTELDAIEVCTQGGCIGLNMGESALVTSANARPTRTRERAHWNPPNPRRQIGARNDDTNDAGEIATIKRQVFAGLAYTGAGLTANEEADIRGYLNGATLVEGGVMQGYRASNNDQGDSGSITEIARSGSVANGDFMLLGTWTNANWSGANPTTLAQSAFVIGQPTSQSVLASASGLRGRYNLAVGTPVFSSSGTGTLLSSSNVTVDFRNAFGHVDMDLRISLPPNQIENSFANSSMPGAGGQDGFYTLTGTATATSAGFSGALGITSTTNNTHEGSGNASGFFGGPQAGSLGLSFTGNTYSHGALAGAGVFTRGQGGAIPVTPTNSPVFADGMKLHVLDGSNYFDFNFGNPNNTFYAGEGSATFSGSQLTSWSSSCSSNCSPDIAQSPLNATPTQQYGAVGVPGSANFLGWGSWAAGTVVDDGLEPLTNVHYIVGTPSANRPYSGTASYSLIGGSVPTSTLGGTGRLLESSNLSVNFGANSLTANIGLMFGSTDASFSQSAVISGSSFTSGGCANRFISGIFTGPNAMRAGLVYGVNGHPTLGNIRGAAAFQQNGLPSTPP